MVLQLNRLNMDSSWKLSWGNLSMLIDPWLIGSEVDIAKWFNEQWHATKPVHPDDCGAYQLIAVTQSYSDHCHEMTLRALDEKVPIWVTPKAGKRLESEGFGPRLKAIPNWLEGPASEAGLELGYLDPGRKMDPVYYAFVVARDANAMVYAPHGFKLSDAQMESLQDYEVEVLITTFMTYKLPALLGGMVNPGLGAAAELANQLKPKHIIPTHDEPKTAKGLVGRLARIRRPAAEEVSRYFEPAQSPDSAMGQKPFWLAAPDYSVLEFPGS